MNDEIIGSYTIGLIKTKDKEVIENYRRLHATDAKITHEYIYKRGLEVILKETVRRDG